MKYLFLMSSSHAAIQASNDAHEAAEARKDPFFVSYRFKAQMSRYAAIFQDRPYGEIFG